MKKFIILFVILVFPTAFYIFLSYGVERYRRTPVFGPRQAIEITGTDGKKKTDTSYFKIPAFEAKRCEGGNFSLSAYQGRMYVTAFLHPDSSKNGYNMGPLLTEYKIKKGEYRRISFLFFWPSDSSSAAPAPDLAAQLKISKDSALIICLPKQQYDSLRSATYFISDPARQKEPFTQKMYDLVLVDKEGKIRGYYNGRYPGKVKELKEDIRHILQHDEAEETTRQTKIEQKQK
ncbi:MAG: hypothetical protein FD123_1147 [Bacteroidetes bacterium]|nr:MAG: hypothetical protein FD123_1147 [Bacteroidota bacterium]